MGNNAKKFTDKQLLDLIVGQGKKQKEAAEILEVTKGAISRRLKALRKKTTAVIVSKDAAHAVDSQIRVMDQLKNCNDEANRLLDQLENEPGLKLKCLAEIRGQLSFMVTIFQSLYSAQAAQDFQESILQVLEDFDPYVRQQVIQKLNEKSALRESLRFD